MFEVTLMVEDNKLSKLLWQLDGLVVGQPKAVPVRNAVAQGNKVVAADAEAGNGSMSERVLQALRNSGRTQITTLDIKQRLERLGGSPSYYGGIAAQLLEAGHLSRVGRGQYELTTPKQGK